MSTKRGKEAEAAAAEFLRSKKFKILDQNWRNRWCEIDIVVKKKNTVYFVEVKYRQSGEWGTGLEYITPKKLSQMQFAAEFWVNANQWDGDYQLSCIAVEGEDYKISEWIEEIAL